MSELRIELWRLLRAAGLIYGALLLLVLLLRFVPYTQVVSLAIASVVVIAACVVGFEFAYVYNRPLLAWLLSWSVVPAYVFLLDVLVPHEPHALDGLAYVFGTIWSVLAGGLGVLGSVIVRRVQRSDT